MTRRAKDGEILPPDRNDPTSLDIARGQNIARHTTLTPAKGAFARAIERHEARRLEAYTEKVNRLGDAIEAEERVVRGYERLERAAHRHQPDVMARIKASEEADVDAELMERRVRRLEAADKIAELEQRQRDRAREEELAAAAHERKLHPRSHKPRSKDNSAETKAARRAEIEAEVAALDAEIESGELSDAQIELKERRINELLKEHEGLS